VRFTLSGLLLIALAICEGASSTTPPTKKPVAVSSKAPGIQTATTWLRGMTLRDEVAQMVMAPFSGHLLHPKTRAYREFVKLVATEHIGGLILVNVTQGRTVAKAEPLDVAAFLNKMQRLSKVPMLVGADLERGASMRLNNTTMFPHAMAFAAANDLEGARYEGQITAREARAIGLQWIFFPVADVNNNPDNPVINIRSYGEDPLQVAALVNAYIEGAHSEKGAKVLTTVKHFPGHGDTATDSHMNMATIIADRSRMDSMEFIPFRSAIEHGVDSVMTAHIAVPALDGPDVPATLSSKIMTGILRDEFGFKGLIVTDALEMGGIARGFGVGEAAVKAVQAGADVLLMPPDVHAAIEAVVAAVGKGTISRARIQQSVMRILEAKAKVGLGTTSLVNLEAINDEINSPDSIAKAQDIADKSVTLVKNADKLVPLREPAKACFWSLAEGRTSIEGMAMAAELRKSVPGAKMIMLDTTTSEDEIHKAEEANSSCDINVVAAFLAVAAYRGNTALAGNFPALVTRLLDSKKPMVLIAMGNPYLLRNYPEVAAYLTTYSTVPPSEIAAVKALLGDIPINGKLPVTIPNLAKLGEGITSPALQKKLAAKQ
jgi:beta-N-acetylhexosaminidase